MMRGGTENVLLRILQSPTAIEHSVLVLAWPDVMTAAYEQTGAPLLHLNMQRPADLPLFLPRIIKAVRRFNPDVVTGWLYHGNLAAGIAARVLHKPYVFNIRHSLDALAKEKRTTRASIRVGALLSRKASAVILNSRRSARQHESVGYARNLQTIPNGIEQVRFIRNASQDDTRRDLSRGLSLDLPTIATVGRLDPAKDYATLFAALTRLNARPVQVLMAGKGLEDGNSAFEKLAEPARAAGHRIIGLGEVNDPRRVYWAADLYVSSSKTEALPNVILEAMAAGLPCVATDVGDCRDVIGESGWIVSPESPSELAEAIEMAVAAGADELQARGNAARSIVRERFALDVMVTQFERVWRSAAEETGGW